METVLIFLPRSLLTIGRGRLVGIFAPQNDKTSDAFYVLALKNAAGQSGFEDIGFVNMPLDEIRANYVSVTSDGGALNVGRVVKDFQDYPLSQCHVIEYDETSLIKSELYIQDHIKSGDDFSKEGDYFKVLTYHLKKLNRQLDDPPPPPAPLTHVLSFLNYITVCLDFTKLSAFSSIGLHIRDFIINLRWFLQKVHEDKWITLQTGNMFLSMVVDIAAGLAIAYVLENVTRHTKRHVFTLMAGKTEELLEFIKYMIKWLMGSPAGLKLNYPLNYILGNFFLYNIYLWWTFLGLIRPLLEIGFNAFLRLGFLGIALQISILADIFSLVTFHLYCIYIYAARLYEFQIRGIISLSKIFLGRKRNPEPDKVDSCPYSTEQLFVGTVCFTVLLFLLPTTLVYYVVFTLIRLGFIFFGGILTRARYLLQILPLYSSLVWMVFPKLMITTTKLVPVGGLSCAGVVTLKAVPDVSSWFDTMARCVPSVLHRPKPVDWKAIIENVLSGKLIYPV